MQIVKDVFAQVNRYGFQKLGTKMGTQKANRLDKTGVKQDLLMWKWESALLKEVAPHQRCSYGKKMIN